MDEWGAIQIIPSSLPTTPPNPSIPFSLTSALTKMGFPLHMIHPVLIHDFDLIQNNLSKAVELLVKHPQGWLHTFVPEDAPKGIFSEPSEEVCAV